MENWILSSSGFHSTDVCSAKLDSDGDNSRQTQQRWIQLWLWLCVAGMNAFALKQQPFILGRCDDCAAPETQRSESAAWAS